MRPIHLEEIARRFPKITVLGAHCGNPEYEWAAEVARWNPNVYFDLSGSSLTKKHAPLNVIRNIFLSSNIGRGSKAAADGPGASVKLVVGADTSLDGIASVLG